MRQASGEFPWTCGAEAQQGALAELEERRRQSAAWDGQQPGDRIDQMTQERRTHPLNKIQTGGGIVDVWYLDDGTVVTVPQLVLPWLQAYDRVSEIQGGKRNLQKTIVTLYAPVEAIAAKRSEWKLEELSQICTIAHMSDRGKPWAWPSARRVPGQRTSGRRQRWFGRCTPN